MIAVRFGRDVFDAGWRSDGVAFRVFLERRVCQYAFAAVFAVGRFFCSWRAWGGCGYSRSSRGFWRSREICSGKRTRFCGIWAGLGESYVCSVPPLFDFGDITAYAFIFRGLDFLWGNVRLRFDFRKDSVLHVAEVLFDRQEYGSVNVSGDFSRLFDLDA